MTLNFNQISEMLSACERLKETQMPFKLSLILAKNIAKLKAEQEFYIEREREFAFAYLEIDEETQQFKQIEEGVFKIKEGKEKEIDLLECQGKYSMNVFSVGFDCEVARNVDRFKKLPRVSGSLAYKMSIVYCLFTKRKHPVKIYLDGKLFEKADYKNTTLLAVAANGKYYGGGIKVAPLAVYDDGYMDFVHCNTLSVFKFIPSKF